MYPSRRQTVGPVLILAMQVRFSGAQIMPRCNLHDLRTRGVSINVCCRSLVGYAGHRETLPSTGTTFAIDRSLAAESSLTAFKVIISTGKSDWGREVTEEKDSLAYHLSNVQPKHSKRSKSGRSDKYGTKESHGDATQLPGMFNTSDPSVTRLSILNGSHTTASDDDSLQTVIVLPDYKAVLDVESSQEGAEALWSSVLDPSIGRAGGVNKQLKTWMLPYACVILLCAQYL